MADTEPALCRSCGHDGLQTFLSLGKTPLADALVTEEQLTEEEAVFPLDVAFCPECALVQILGDVPPEMLFVDNYLYFSSFSDHLLAHSRDHALGLIERLDLGPDSLVVEIASNDGYLLRNFVEHGIPVLGIEPAPDQADAAETAGIPTRREFFGIELARELVESGQKADVIIANNVMAHVPDLNGFVAGMAHLLEDDGVITVENPSVDELVERCAFDTIYHEHHCYFSCLSVSALAARHGLSLNRVDSFPDLHGGTLRWSLGKKHEPHVSVARHVDAETEAGVGGYAYYEHFADEVNRVERDLRALLEGLKADGATIAAYGAAAKGATLVNVVGIGTDLVDFVVDRNTHKQGRYMPGTHLPIRPVEALLEEQPDYVLLLAWNFAEEIRNQQAEYERRGGRFIVPVPTPEVLS
ncbi:MAG: class I SAM-dependent methyltransferase [Acidimicrobiales bacterium]|nr:class I SAM-dependent methyltransferase [Acidimicrobiales bacterium]